MRLTVLGSSSSGNGYVLRADHGGETLLLEAGLPLKAALRAIDYDIASVVGCLVTHEHGDHTKHVREALDDTTAPVYMSQGTWEAIEGRTKSRRRPETASHGRQVRLGGYTAMPIECAVVSGGEKVWLHDAAEPICWLIRHEEMGTLLFATDLYCLPSTKWDGLSNIMVECNYDTDTLKENYESGRIPKARYERAWVSHMGCDTLCGQLARMELGGVSKIVLLHGSGENGNRKKFEAMVQEATGKPAITAEPGLVTHLWRIN